MRNTRLYIIGDITQESYLDFTKELHESQSEDIIIELTSDGGCALTAMAFYDRIRSCGKNVTIEARGNVGSAAVLILAAGHIRLMSPNAWVYLHEEQLDGTEAEGLGASLHKASIERVFRLENRWNKLLEDATGTSAEIWEDLNRKITRLDREECLTLGLATGVI